MSFLQVPTATVLPFAGISAPAGWLFCDGSAVNSATYPALFNALTITISARGNGTTIDLIPSTANLGVGMTVEWAGSTTGITITSIVNSTTITISSTTGLAGSGLTFTVLPFGQGISGTTSTFGLPDFRGRAPVGKDNMGGTAANRITVGNSGVKGTVLGANGGVESVALTAAQSGMPAHNHTANIYSNSAGGTGALNQTYNSVAGYVGDDAGTMINNAGAQNASAAHSNTQPSIILHYIIKV